MTPFDPFLSVYAHSYGADTAATVIAAGHTVDTLVTYDAVGWTQPDFASVANNSGSWQDSYVSGGANVPDVVASIGGAWRGAPGSYGNSRLVQNANHVSIAW